MAFFSPFILSYKPGRIGLDFGGFSDVTPVGTTAVVCARAGLSTSMRNHA